MKNIVKNSVATLVALTVVNTPLLASTSHCNANENVVFSCNTGKKVVSVCASKAINAKSGYMQYRFGKLGNPEAIIPAKPESFRQNAFYTETIVGMGQRRIGYGLDFKNGPFSYYININTEYGGGTLSVYNKDKNIATLTCQEDNLLIDNIYIYNFEKIGVRIEN